MFKYVDNIEDVQLLVQQQSICNYYNGWLTAVKGDRNMQEAQHEIKKSLEALFCTHKEYQMNLGLLAPCNLIY